MATESFKTVLRGVLFLSGVGLVAILPAQSASAEGSYQLNVAQEFNSSTILYADILNSGETINISTCSDTNIEIYDTNGTPRDDSDDTQVASTFHSANLTCEVALPNPITGAYKYTPSTVGTYRITLDNDQSTYDFSVTANNSTNPNPANANGRIWSYRWYLYANDNLTQSSNDYPEDTATNADLYSLVPAPLSNEYFVWKLDLNKFAGGSYQLAANATGLNAPYAGYSAAQSGTTNDMTPLYPIYLSYPAKGTSQNSTVPSITGFMFRDSAGEDNVFSPGATIGVQDTGTFQFNSNVANATYAITIDTNHDGVYGTGDRLLLGQATAGLNTVTWDGKYANGTVVPAGDYNARLQLRIGEFHFVARDVEASGGTYDHVTWNNGLAIYRALNPTTSQSVRMFWDDITELKGRPFGSSSTRLSTPYPEATSNLPNGVLSGDTADANGDGKADGFHSWGDFDGYSMGNRDFIDTYVYGEDDSAISTLSVSSTDVATDLDGISNAIENGAPNGGDGNGDGTADYLQNDVTSLPNPVSNGAYNTVAVTGCNSLSNVSIVSEKTLSSQDVVHEYPLGLFKFDISCLTPGATANVKIYYDKVYDTSSWQARKFISNAYGAISGASFGTATVGGNQVTTLSYSISDGGAGDEDGAVNGVIVDPAGPGVTSVDGNGQALAGTGMDLKTILTMTLLLVVVGGISLVAAMQHGRRTSMRK